MNLFVRSHGKMQATARGALLGATCALTCAASAALAQDAPQTLGKPDAPVVLAQVLQQQQQQQRQRQQSQQAAPVGPRPGEIAGRYAVLREENKDTLCMVTLFDTARGSGTYRAQLAPACRDNGIVIFDPIAWSIDRQGHIALTARKGHKMLLERDSSGIWQRVKTEPKARPLGLRRI